MAATAEQRGLKAAAAARELGIVELTAKLAGEQATGPTFYYSAEDRQHRIGANPNATRHALDRLLDARDAAHDRGAP